MKSLLSAKSHSKYLCVAALAAYIAGASLHALAQTPAHPAAAAPRPPGYAEVPAVHASDAQQQSAFGTTGTICSPAFAFLYILFPSNR